RLRNLKGFGAKTEQSLLAVVQQERKKPSQRLYMHHALSTGGRVVEYLHTLDGLIEVSFAGSLRRQKETVGTIEIVASAKDPANLIKLFLDFPLLLSNSGDDANHCLVQLAARALVS